MMENQMGAEMEAARKFRALGDNREVNEKTMKIK